jgi:hypothetical protein
MANKVSTEQQRSRRLRTSTTTRAVPHLDVKILTAKTPETEEMLDESWPTQIDYDSVKVPDVPRSSEVGDEWMDVLDALPEG